MTRQSSRDSSLDLAAGSAPAHSISRLGGTALLLVTVPDCVPPVRQAASQPGPWPRPVTPRRRVTASRPESGRRRSGAWYCVALNDKRWPASGGPGALPDPNSPLAQSAGPMITARPGVSRLSQAREPGGPSDDTDTRAVDGPGHPPWPRTSRAWPGGMLSTDSDSERPLRRWPGPSRTRMIGCNGGCAGCEPGTRWTQGRTRGAAGGGGSGSVPAPTASSVPASWPPEKCNGFFGWNGRLKLVGALRWMASFRDRLCGGSGRLRRR